MRARVIVCLCMCKCVSVSVYMCVSVNIVFKAIQLLAKNLTRVQRYTYGVNFD